MIKLFLYVLLNNYSMKWILFVCQVKVTRDNVVDQTGASVSMISTDVLMGIDEVKYKQISRLCSKTGKEVDHSIFLAPLSQGLWGSL